MLTSIKIYFSDLTFWDWLLVFLDIFIVAFIIYLAFIFIKGTKATRIVYGLAILIIVLVLGRLARLETVNWALDHLTLLILVAIPVIFQPEIRRALEKIGRSKFLLLPLPSKRQKEKIISVLISSLAVLSKNKVGALIVLQRKTELGEYIETGERLDALLSHNLLLNIFYPNAPLHDGAVIVSGDRILAARCTLPLSEEEQTYTYGTRHRAALGLSEISDAIICVVSEETGNLSLAKDGKIKEDLNLEEFEKELRKSL